MSEQQASNSDYVENFLESEGYLKKNDLSQLLEDTKSLTVKEMLDHKACGDSNCGMCNMRKGIDEAAFRRGVNKGIAIHKKFPMVIPEE